MTNIISYGISIPAYQIQNEILDPVYGKRKKGSRAIISPDEDPITLACDAAFKCLEGTDFCKQVDALIYATTTPVFKDRSAASFIAGMIGLKEGILAIDLCSSPRSGSEAIYLADKLIKSKACKNVLVLASETHFPEIGMELRTSFGHAGCAVLLSLKKGFAEISNVATYSTHFAEEFTYKEKKIKNDSRFGTDEGIKSAVSSSLQKFFGDYKKTPDDFDVAIFGALNAKKTLGVFKKAGFNLEEQLLMDSIIHATGFTGTCHSLLLLIDAMENNSGKVLVIDYYNGVNILEIKQTSEIFPGDNTSTCQLKNKKQIVSYQDYLKIRESSLNQYSTKHSLDIFSSEMMQKREKESVIDLKGYECTSCKSIYYMPAKACKKCKNEEFSMIELQKEGLIFSFTMEHYFPAPFPPVGMIVIDLDGGGRITLQSTDDIYKQDHEKIKIDAKVELVLRKMMEADAKPNYFWKCRIIE